MLLPEGWKNKVLLKHWKDKELLPEGWIALPRGWSPNHSPIVTQRTIGHPAISASWMAITATQTVILVILVRTSLIVMTKSTASPSELCWCPTSAIPPSWMLRPQEGWNLHPAFHCA